MTQQALKSLITFIRLNSSSFVEKQTDIYVKLWSGLREIYQQAANKLINKKHNFIFELILTFKNL